MGGAKCEQNLGVWWFFVKQHEFKKASKWPRGFKSFIDNLRLCHDHRVIWQSGGHKAQTSDRRERTLLTDPVGRRRNTNLKSWLVRLVQGICLTGQEPSRPLDLGVQYCWLAGSGSSRGVSWDNCPAAQQSSIQQREVVAPSFSLEVHPGYPSISFVDKAVPNFLSASSLLRHPPRTRNFQNIRNAYPHPTRRSRTHRPCCQSSWSNWEDRPLSSLSSRNNVAMCSSSAGFQQIYLLCGIWNIQSSTTLREKWISTAA